MKKKDHRALGAAIADYTNNPMLLKHRKAFILGCVEPDYNLFTYLRGCKSHRNVCGHNEKNIEKHITRLTERLERTGVNNSADYFRLGTLIHYIADTFTYPHTRVYNGTMKHHIAYEQTLHRYLKQALYSLKYELWLPIKESSAAAIRHSYETLPHSVQKDCQYIISSCIKTVTELLPGENYGYIMPANHTRKKKTTS